MKNFPAFKLKFFFMVHNVLLTLVSGALLVLMVEKILPIIYHKGFLAAICDQSSWTQPLELLYYLNYLVKYWELIDTIFLVLKKKKLGKLLLLYMCRCRYLLYYRIPSLLSSLFNHGPLLYSAQRQNLCGKNKIHVKN